LCSNLFTHVIMNSGSIFFDCPDPANDRLCGLLVRVLGYRGLGSIPGTTKKIVCLERGPLSLVSTTEELLDRKVAAPV
jgi:hypothetical protein